MQTSETELDGLIPPRGALKVLAPADTVASCSLLTRAEVTQATGRSI